MEARISNIVREILNSRETSTDNNKEKLINSSLLQDETIVFNNKNYKLTTKFPREMLTASE